jgi:Predicted membrane protein
VAGQPKRQGLAGRRAAGALAVAAATLTAALLAGADVPVAITGAWGVAALVLVSWIWLTVRQMDPGETKAHAQAEDSSRLIADITVLVASVASLVAIGYTVHTAGNRAGTTKALLIVLAIGVVAVSWLAVHMIYTLRYGDRYYGHPVGGIDFNDDEPPDYHDFAYLALTIGMTFQVSDTSLTAKQMRRLAIRHALLSFVFVVVIVALTINSVASLLQ